MVKYRRYYVPGGIYFFTVVLQDRQSNWLVKYINELTAAMRRVKQIHPYKIIAMVILPDHLHAMWEMPENDENYSIRWICIKREFAKNLRKSRVRIQKNRFGENELWQRRFWEHAIRDEKDYEKHVDYIHYNPVKHGYVNSVKEWPFSTFHQFVQQGLLPLNWCYQNDDIEVE